MSQKTTLQELEDIFNTIPKDGSNIKETEEDDDNGYAALEGDTSVPFEAKASALSAKIVNGPASPELPRKADEPEPAPVKVEEAPKAELIPVGAELEASLLEAVAETPQPTENFDSLDGPAAPISIARQGVVPESIVEGEEILVPTFEEVTPVVIPPTSILAPKEPETAPAKVEEKVADTLIPETGDVDREGISDSENTKVTTEKTADEDNSEESEFDSDGWKLTTNVKQFEEFYRDKRWCLKRLLPNGRLPFQRWAKELAESKAIVECSYDTTAMFEQMKYVQSLKVRVTEIIVQLNSQYFKWKRFMAVLRAEAARMEGAKVAQGDAAALRHLRDFEDYFGDLEGLMETAEGVIKNLESGWDTLNRGVTIVLQAHGHERGMTRYEPQGYVPQPTRPLPQQHKPQSVAELGAFDSLDATEPPPAAPKKKGSDSWDVVQDFGGKYPRR